MRPSSLEQGIEHEKPAVEKILRAALRCLARSESVEVSMREIAAEAGVSKSLLHYHFRSKDELLLALIDRLFGAMVRRVEAVTDRLTVESSGPGALLGSLDAIWTELRAARDVQAILLRIAARATTDDALRQRMIRLRTRLQKIMVEGLRLSLGKAARPEMPLEGLAELMVALLVGLEAGRLFAEDARALDAAFDLVKVFAFQLYGTLEER